MKSNGEKTYQFNLVLDQKILSKLYENDLDYIMQMFEIYLDMIEGELRRLKNAFEEKDRKLIRQVAHKIKPVFIMVGLPKLNALAEQIELEYNSVEESELISLISALHDEVIRTSPILTSEIEAIKKVKTKLL